MSRKLFLVILFFLFLFSSTGKAEQQTGADEAIRRLREARERTRDFSADLLQEKRIFLLKEKIVSRGRIRYKVPDKVWIEFFPPEPSQMVFDGKTFLLYFKEEKLAERYRIQANPIAERYLPFTRDPFQKELADWKVIEDRELFLVMEILPKGKETLFAKTRLWVSKKDWIVTGMEMVEKNGDSTVLRYSNMKVNAGLTDSDFVIPLPKDVRVTEIK